jgi:hypothetical protein
MNNFKKEENKKGFLPFLSRLFGSSAKTAAGMHKASGLGALFSTKAGILGVVLGGATIAAGVGVVYNFISPSSGKVYSPDLFQKAYYEEQVKSASVERKATKQMASQSQSTIDMFKEQAKKEGIGLEESANKENQETNQQPADASAQAPESSNVSAPTPAGGSKLNASLGFNGAKGGGSSVSKLQTSGGLAGGIGQKFAPVYRPANQAYSAQASSMKGALASNIKNSPKYTLPNIQRKGAFGQAKFARNSSSQASFSASDAGARTAAEAAFTGETGGSGDVETPDGGVGLGGAGVSDGKKLKSNDPNLNKNEIDPPTPEKKEDTPWKDLENKCLNALAMAGIAWALFSILKKIEKTTPWIRILTMAVGAIAIGYALVAMKDAYKLYKDYGQKMLALTYGSGSIYIIYDVIKSMFFDKGYDKSNADIVKDGKDSLFSTAGATSTLGTVGLVGGLAVVAWAMAKFVNVKLF